MRILMLCDSLGIGGAETHILTLALGLLDGKNEVTLISAGGAYEDRLISAGAICINAPLTKRDPISIARSYKIIKRHIKGFDIIHAHTRLTSYLVHLARGKYSLPKTVVTAHLNFSSSGIGKFTKWGDMTLAVSEDIREHLVKAFGVRREQILLTKNGIDLDEYRGKMRDEKRILHISRIDGDRALVSLLLCRIAPTLLCRFCDYVIEIYGDGDMMDELRAAASEANSALGRRGVILHGATASVADALGGGGIFVGVSRAALEAMAMRLPTVIAGNEGFGGVIRKEMITNMIKTNFCARGLCAANEERLIRDITALIEDDCLYEESARLGYETVLRNYTKESMVADAMSAYRLARGRLKLSLLGYFGFGNLGDETTLRVLSEHLKQRGIEISGVISRRSSSEKSLISIIGESDALLLGGGNLLQNETSLLSLLYYASVMLMALAMKKRTLALASGVGEIRGAAATVITRLTVSRLYRIGARTRYDKEMFRRFGAERIGLMPDLCFTLARGLGSDDMSRESFLVIVKDKGRLSEDIIRHIASESGLAPIVAIISESDDKDRCRLLCKSLGTELTLIKDYDKLCEVISGCRFCVSERLHGAIFSLVAKRKCFIDTDSKKLFALYEEISLRCKSLEIPPLLSPIDGLLYGEIKEVGARSSDFEKLLNSLCDDIKSAFDTLI